MMNWRQALILAYVIAYVIVGLDTSEKLKQRASPLQDLRYYERAVQDAIRGTSPYSILSIGPGFFYPPPSLLLIEPINAIRNDETKVHVVTSINFLLVGAMIFGIIRYFRLPHVEMWYWYVLGLLYAPLQESAHLGQLNIVPLFGLSLFFLFVKRQSFIAGASLALAILSKVSPAIFLLFVLIERKWRVLAATITSFCVLCVVAALRYGVSPLIEYPSVLRWLSEQLPLGTVPQSFEARVDWLLKLPAFYPDYFGWLSPYLNFCRSNFLTQHGLTCYLCGVLALSSLFLVRSRHEHCTTFVIYGLSMTLAPNVMWYHHYIFMLLPLFVWMGHSKLSYAVTLWCLSGFFIIQVDRWQLTHGLLIHVFGHLSIIAILVAQGFRFMHHNETTKRIEEKKTGFHTSIESA